MATKWGFETEYIQSCNCTYGCPCNFNGYPDKGHCEAFVGYKIRNGKFGDTKLDGVKFALAFWWPKAIHEGGGTARDRKSTRLNSSHRCISYAVFCLKKKNER